MTTREKVIQLIDELSDEQLAAEYERLLNVTKPRPTDAEFSEALDRVAALAQRLNVSADVVALMREERDWHANRWP